MIRVIVTIDDVLHFLISDASNRVVEVLDLMKREAGIENKNRVLQEYEALVCTKAAVNRIISAANDCKALIRYLAEHSCFASQGLFRHFRKRGT